VAWTIPFNNVKPEALAPDTKIGGHGCIGNAPMLFLFLT
jgi:hypothetical protein